MEQGTRPISAARAPTPVPGCKATLCICLYLSNKLIKKLEKSKTQGLGLSFDGMTWVTLGEL